MKLLGKSIYTIKYPLCIKENIKNSYIEILCINIPDGKSHIGIPIIFYREILNNILEIGNIKAVPLNEFNEIFKDYTIT